MTLPNRPLEEERALPGATVRFGRIAEDGLYEPLLDVTCAENGTFILEGVHTSDASYLEISMPGFQTERFGPLVSSTPDSVFVSQPSGLNDIFLRRDPAAFPNYLPIDGPTGLDPINYAARQVGSLAVAPTNSNILFAVNSSNLLRRSFDRGATFTTPHPAFLTGSSSDYINDVQIAPDNPNVAYVARSETGVWKTTNGGATFTRLVNSPVFIAAIAIHPANTSVLYASGGTYTGDGIYKSTDGGDTWALQVPPGAVINRSYNSFYFDPVDENTVYAMAFGGPQKTVDGGAHWTDMNLNPYSTAGSAASALLIDPLIPTTMILVSSTGQPGFLRSVDGGVNWQETTMNLPGRDFVLYRAVMPAPGLIVAGAGTGVVEYTVAPDLGLTVSSTPTALPLGTTQPITFTISNDGPHASSASEITMAGLLITASL